MFINACNPDILSLWRGNVDLQYVINDILITYISCETIVSMIVQIELSLLK